jgi:hypothetical protein
LVKHVISAQVEKPRKIVEGGNKVLLDWIRRHGTFINLNVTYRSRRRKCHYGFTQFGEF